MGRLTRPGRTYSRKSVDPEGRPIPPRTQLHADVLVSIVQDSLDGTNPEGRSSPPVVSIFVDAHIAAQTNGEAGAEIDTGSRIGPLTLEQILCHGKVEIITSDAEGTPLSVGPTMRTIPPQTQKVPPPPRRRCLHRRRLPISLPAPTPPHQPKTSGGTHDPDNLTTLCWFHHHIVIHRNGYHIDPSSPPQRRRFLRPDGRDPP